MATNNFNDVKTANNLFETVKHLLCAAHLLNLVAVYAIKNTDHFLELLTKVKNEMKGIKKKYSKHNRINKETDGQE